MDELQELWEKAEEAAGKNYTGKGKRYFLKRIDPERDMHVGVTAPEMLRVFVISLHEKYLPSPDLPKSKGFEVKIDTQIFNEKGKVNIILSLTNKDFSDLFTTLVLDIMHKLENEKNEKSVVKNFIDLLIKWQKFCEKFGVDWLPEKAQRGLYGELYFLNYFLFTLFTPAEAVDFWVGPKGFPQDFHITGKAVEVKTSKSKLHQKIIISNEQQLDDKGLDSLFLLHFSLKDKIGSGETLVDMVEKIRRILSDEGKSRVEFDEKLADMGYLDAHKTHYSNTGYFLRSSNVFRVKDGFPRIIEKEIRNGVGDVHYSINLSECVHFSVSEKSFKNKLKGD